MNAFRMHSSPNLQGGRIQDSKFQTEFWKDSRFKIPKKNSWIQRGRIQDSRNFFWALNLESWNLPPWIQDFFSEPWILNLETYPLGFKNFFLSLESWILNPTSLDSRSFFWALNLESWILPPWIQEFFLESWILNPTSLDSRSFFLSLESWILNPTPLDSRILFGILNLESWPFCTRLLRNSWILDLRFGEECILNAFFAKSSENRAKRTNKNIGSFKVKMHIHSMLETLLIPIKTSQN